MIPRVKWEWTTEESVSMKFVVSFCLFVFSCLKRIFMSKGKDPYYLCINKTKSGYNGPSFSFLITLFYILLKLYYSLLPSYSFTLSLVSLHSTIRWTVGRDVVNSYETCFVIPLLVLVLRLLYGLYNFLIVFIWIPTKKTFLNIWQ